MKRNLIITTITSLVSWTVLLAILFTLSPTQLGLGGVMLFLVVLTAACASLFTVIGFYVRLFYTNNAMYYKNFSLALRQGTLAALCIALLLLFAAMKLLTPITGFLVVCTFMFFELFFQGLT